jgi:hypothetical protein
MNIRVPMVRGSEFPVACWKKPLQNIGMMTDTVYWHEKLCAVSKDLDTFSTRKYNACKVYVIFETEEAQRKCLEQLTTGLIPALLEKSKKITTDLKFRGTNVLKVEEPSEVRAVTVTYSYINSYLRVS